jgi:hypothetical protein
MKYMLQTKWEKRFDSELIEAVYSSTSQTYTRFKASPKEVKQFISNLRKADEEALIKMLPVIGGKCDKWDAGYNTGIEKARQLIKDYYKSN